MSIDKSEIKKLTTQEIGRKIESFETEVKVQLNSFDGAIKALISAIDCLNKHKNTWKTLLEQQKTNPIDYEVSQKVISECVGILNNLYESAKMQKFIKQGEASMCSKTLDVCENIYHEEDRKAKALLDVLNNPPVQDERLPNRNVKILGQHPGESIKTKRNKK